MWELASGWATGEARILPVSSGCVHSSRYHLLERSICMLFHKKTGEIWWIQGPAAGQKPRVSYCRKPCYLYFCIFITDFCLDQLEQDQDFSAFILSVFLCVAIHVHTYMCIVCLFPCELTLTTSWNWRNWAAAGSWPDLAHPSSSYSQDYHTVPFPAFKDKTYRICLTFIWREKRNISKS